MFLVRCTYHQYPRVVLDILYPCVKSLKYFLLEGERVNDRILVYIRSGLFLFYRSHLGV